jgi:predicted MPP superfamily phosphohydrolase
VRETRVRSAGWTATRPPLRIAVLTDLHVGSFRNGLDRLDEVVARTNAANPDLVVILGDLVIHDVLLGHFVPPETTAAHLAGLRAPHGVVAVLGNHDWWLDGPRVRGDLERAGIRVLENDAIPIGEGPQRFWVAGLGDLWTRPVSIPGALARVPDDEPVLLLTHNPDVFPDVPARVTLTLAGHTHGGQVALPILGRPVVPSRYGQRYADGLVVEDGRTLFVSSGIGTSILPVRFGVPPEIAIVTLSAP